MCASLLYTKYSYINMHYMEQVASELKSVKAIVMYKGEAPDVPDCGFPVYTWKQFMEVM